MKEYEKLAIEYVCGPTCEVMDTDMAHQDSFIAGFMKAREMIVADLGIEVSGEISVRIYHVGEKES